MRTVKAFDLSLNNNLTLWLIDLKITQSGLSDLYNYVQMSENQPRTHSQNDSLALINNISIEICIKCGYHNILEYIWR